MGRSVIADDYWKQHAELFRKAGGMAVEPDPPIWVEAGKVAEGTLSEMLNKWSDLPASHQAHHGIRVHASDMSAETIHGLIDQSKKAQ
jgi:hypothetical protein